MNHYFKSMNKRKCSYWSGDIPLTSKRVNGILSNPLDSKKLSDCIRSSRSGLNKPFFITSKNV
jgi:hypothetical protein